MSQRRMLKSRTQSKCRRPLKRRGRHSDVQQALRRYGAVDFFNTLAGPFGTLVDSLLPAHRERLYPPTVTASMFISQSLHADHSCQRVVNEWAVMRAVEGLPEQSVATGGYCRARKRLSTGMVSTLARATGQILSDSALTDWRWRRRTVKLIDGTGISMPDTPANRAQYPQLSSQAEGVGFPLARLVAVLCLGTGAILDASIGPFEGKGNGEHGLMRQLLSAFTSGDIVLGDGLYSSYWLIAALKALGVDGVFAQHQGRHTDFRRGRRLGKRDHVVTWKKPRQAPSWMPAEDYAACAPVLTMREVSCGRRVLVTTLLDARDVSRHELDQLYNERWHVELDLRNIKTTLGMDVLRCLSPDMVEKELWTYLLGYNLIRIIMAESAVISGCRPRDISFKHAVQLTLSGLTLRSTGRRRLKIDTLCEMIAKCRVGKRPGRIEPRARKRRPKSFAWLKVPRHIAQQQIRDLGYLPNPK